MKIIFHGKFAEDYGPEHEIQEDNIAKALSALTRQLKFYEDQLLLDRPVMRVVGHSTIESLSECPDEIHVIPQVAGGKGVGKILVGAALIGVTLIPGVGQFLGPSLASAILGVGISFAIGGITELFIKAPSLSREGDPEASQYLGLSNNTTEYGTLRSYSMGRIRLTAPHLLALNVDSTDIVQGEFPA